MEKDGLVRIILLVCDNTTNTSSTNTSTTTYTWDDLVQWQKDGMPYNTNSSNTSSNTNSTVTKYYLLIDDIDAFDIVSSSSSSLSLSSSSFNFISKCHSSINSSSNSSRTRSNSSIISILMFGRNSGNDDDSISNNDAPLLSDFCK